MGLFNFTCMTSLLWNGIWCERFLICFLLILVETNRLILSLRFVKKLTLRNSSEQLFSKHIFFKSNFPKHSTVFICPPWQIWKDLIHRTVWNILVHTVTRLSWKFIIQLWNDWLLLLSIIYQEEMWSDRTFPIVERSTTLFPEGPSQVLPSCKRNYKWGLCVSMCVSEILSNYSWMVGEKTILKDL